MTIMDCVTSVGGVPVEMDAWGIDVLYTGTQKCLSCPPGLSPGLQIAGMGLPQLAGPGGLDPALLSAQALPEPTSEVDQMINIAQIEGRVKASSVKKVGEIIEKHPEEAIAILRSWLYEAK